MSDPELTPAEEQVRRLLADARHTEPVPDDVAARLDGALADLRAEPAPRRTRSVIDLATARRRHNARTWLVAAAAAVAIGVGINQLDLSFSGGGDEASSAGGSANQVQVESDGSSASKPEAAAPNEDLVHGLFAGPVVRLDSDRFGAQVRRVADAPAALSGDAGGGAAAYSDDASTRRQLGKACAIPDVSGRLVAVSYDGQRGVLVYRPARGDTQIVDLFLCDRDGPERSITLPRR